jgi:hypothetical protein
MCKSGVPNTDIDLATAEQEIVVCAKHRNPDAIIHRVELLNTNQFLRACGKHSDPFRAIKDFLLVQAEIGRDSAQPPSTPLRQSVVAEMLRNRQRANR